VDKLLKTLGDQNRLRIVNLLMNHKLCVCELEMILQITQSNVSRHLSRLRNEEVITYEKKAQWIYYLVSRKFAEKHFFLYQYLQHIMAHEQVFLDDIQRLTSYEASGENCETVKGKEDVIFAS